MNRPPREIKGYDPKQIARLVRHMRQAACLTQAALGKHLGLARASITNIESGTVPISLAHLMNAASASGFELRLVATDKGRRPKFRKFR